MKKVEQPKVQGMMLKTENLSERVVVWLEKAIVHRELRPGDELPSEQEMCNLLGVGKSSIREALKMLQMIGVVEIRQGKRSRVCDTVKPNIMMPLIFKLAMLDSSPQNLYDFRVMFEEAVVRFARNRIEESSLERLKEEVERFRQKSEAGTATVEDDFAFHKLLLEICDNPFIYEIGNLLIEIFEEPMTKTSPYDAQRALRDHQMIISIFEEGVKEKDKVSEAVRESFEVYRNVLGVEDKASIN